MRTNGYSKFPNGFKHIAQGFAHSTCPKHYKDWNSYPNFEGLKRDGGYRYNSDIGLEMIQIAAGVPKRRIHMNKQTSMAQGRQKSALTE